MNRRKIMLGALLLVSGVAFSQVGVGIKEPHKSTLLHLENKQNDYRGVLIPNVPLEDSKDGKIINKGNILNSLLVYNTTEGKGVTPGFYYWKGTEWVRVIDSKDILDNLDNFPKNKTMAVRKEKNIDVLYVEDTKGNVVSVPLKDINIVTTLEDKGNGKYTFTNEEGTKTTIDVTGSVVNNISEILNDTKVQNDIYNTVAAQGKAATASDGSIKIDNGGQAVLNAMQIAVANQGITPEKIAPGKSTKQLLVTDAQGKVQWVDVTSDIIKDAIKHHEKVTVLENNGDGTLTYYNEHALDEKTGLPIIGKGVRFDANTLNIKERTDKKEKGIYDFYDGHTSLTNPLMTISTRANAIYFDDSTTVIEGDNLQEVIENITKKIEIAQGKRSSLSGEGILINGGKEVSESVLKEMKLTIADDAITSAKIKNGEVVTDKLRNEAVTVQKIKPGIDNYLLVTKNGKADWVPASDSVIKDVVKQNETVTVVVNNNNGTYSYYNEKSIDKDGNPIEGQGTLIDANTLSITDDSKGKYVFNDGNGEIATIDIKGTVITNIDEILSNSTVQETIFKTVAAKGKDVTAIDKSITIEHGNNAALNTMQIAVTDGGITPTKIEPGPDKYLLVTKNGKVDWVPATDEIIKEVIDTNEKITLLVVGKHAGTDEANGTFTYYNEAGVDVNGKPIDGKGVAFDSNTLRVVSTTDGKYNLFDGRSKDIPVATIDVAGTVINNIDEILTNTDVQNSIYTTVANKGKAVTSPNKSITVGGAGDKAVLNALELSIAKGGVGIDEIASAAVTPEKIAPGAKGQLLITNGAKEVQWINSDDEIIKDILKLNQAITILEDHGDGTFTYFNEAAFDSKGVFIPGSKGIKFNANTLRIENNGKGKYEFFDESDKAVPLATIDIQGTVIENITEILSKEEVQNEIFTTVAAKGKKMESNDGSMSITGGDKAVLNKVTINISQDGVKTDHIKDGAVTTDKISSEGATKNMILTADGLNKASFVSPTNVVSSTMKGDLVGEDGVIEVKGGTDVLFGDNNKKVTIEIRPGGITSAHIKNETIQNDDIANKAIKASKLDAEGEEVGAIATVNADGTVSYQTLTPAVIKDKGDIIVKDGITVSENGKEKVLANVTLGLGEGAVAPTKLTPGTDGKFILVTKGGVAQWVAATDTIIEEAVNSNETVTKLVNKGKGIYTYYNEEAVKNTTDGVDIDVNSLKIDSSKPGVYVFNDLTSDTPLATIDISRDVIHSIVTILGDTNVKEEVYKIIANQGKAITSKDKSLAIPDNNKAGLEGLDIGIANAGVKTAHIANGQVTADKLKADGASQEGFVATVNADGTVSYKSLTSTEVSGKAAALKTDGIIQVDNADAKAGTLFKEATLSIKEGGIGTIQLGKDAVTNDKIVSKTITADKLSSQGVGEKKILISGASDEVVWESLSNLSAEAAGDLKGDGIILIKNTDNTTSGAGVKSLFKGVNLSLADKGITNQQIADQTVLIENLSNAGAAGEDMVMVTNDTGGFKYVSKAAIVQNGEDLVLGAGLEFLDANKGDSAVFVRTEIGIANSGITEAKLANGSVSTAKITSAVQGVNAANGAVLTADGLGAVTYKKINENAFDGGGAKLTSNDKSLTIPDNKAVLKDLDIKIAEGGVQTKHIVAGAVTTEKIAEENVTAAKIKGGVAKQLLITNDGGKAEWVDASNAIIEEIIQANESITLLTDNNDGTFTYKNEKNIVEGSEGVMFNANTLRIENLVPGKYVFYDKFNDIPLATIDIQQTIIDNIIELLKEVNVKEEIYKTIAAQGKKVSTDASLSVTGGDQAVLNPMTISLRDGGVTTTKITSTVQGNNAVEGTVLTADGQGNVAFKSLVDVASTQGKAITSTGKSLEIVGNKAALQNLNIDVASEGIKTNHIAAKAVTVNKIGTTESAGKVLTSNGTGGAEFQSLGQVIGDSGKAITAGPAIKITGGEHAVLNDVELDIEKGGITEEKLAENAVTTTKIKNRSVTAEKIVGEKAKQILGTDDSGITKWMDIEDDILKLLIRTNESQTFIKDNKNGTFTYYGEAEFDYKGKLKPNAVGVTFNANTLSIDSSKPGIFVFKDQFDKSGERVIATIDTRAKSIIFEDNSTIGYTNVEEAITNINQKIENLEKLEITKAPLSGQGILVNGKESETDVLFKDVTLSIADEAVTPAKIKGGAAKQLLVTDNNGKTKWVDASDDIIKEVFNTQETVTVLMDNSDGTFTYFNESNFDKDGNLIGAGITFDANTLSIVPADKGKYNFFDKSSTDPIATIDVTGTVIENIKEILNNTTVQNDIYTAIANQGKKVSGDDAIEVIGGDKAALQEMSISLKDKSITEGKLFAGKDKANYVPVVQNDGSVKYQPMTAVVTGQMLNVDTSLEVTGEAATALLKELSLKVKEGGITNTHIKNLAVTTNKISSIGAERGALLVADGSDNANFVSAKDAIATAMNGDIVGKDAIEVIGGENVLLGDVDTSVTLVLKDGGVKGTHIAAETVQNINIKNKTIEATKLNAGNTGVDNRVAIANGTGDVVYQALSANVLSNKGAIKTDDIIHADNGADKVLADVKLSINDNSITASKLNAENAASGAVLTVDANGKTVSYLPLTANTISNKGNITTDGVVTVVDGVGKVLSDVKLGIQDKAIDTKHIADKAVKNEQLAPLAVTADKISSAGIMAKSVLISGAENDVFWGELKDIVTNTAGNLTTDGIITLTKGTGVNTLLADAELSIKANSITKDKLSSKEGATNVARDYILVTDGNGGFDYVVKQAVQAGGEDLRVGSALEFTQGDGLNTVLVPTTMDVKNAGISTEKLQDKAVTTAKISSGDAVANSVLTAKGSGVVAYELLSSTAFEGKGAALKSDNSILVSDTGKNALLKEATISIANDGVDNKHIKANAVTNDKISSKVADKNAGNGAVLTADGNGNTKFQSFSEVATTQGKAVTSTDGSLTVTDKNKAALQDLNITVAKDGIKNSHIAPLQVTADKIGTGDITAGLVLTADGQGKASFTTLEPALNQVGKKMTEGAGIKIVGGDKAALKDVTISVADGGINTVKLAANAVTVDKISSKVNTTNAKNGQVLTADGNGNVTFKEVATQSVSTGTLTGNGPISVSDGKDVVLKDVTLDINAKSITGTHIANRTISYLNIKEGTIGNVELATGAVRTDKILNNQVTTEKIADANVTTAKIADANVTTVKIADGAVSRVKIENLAIDNNKIANNTISGGKLIDKAVVPKKMGSDNAPVGYVLTAEAGGTVAFKAPTGSSVTKKNISKSGTIEATKGATGSVLEDVQLEVLGSSLTGDHIKYNTIQYKNMASNAVQGDVIKDESVVPEKLSSEDKKGTIAPEGYVLMADGKGAASFKKAKGGESGFFYAPSFTVDIKAGEKGDVDVHQMYVDQFDGALSSRQGAKLNTYDYNELDFFVVYYDSDVFEDVRIDGGGVLYYTVKKNPVITAKTYFNVVMQLQDN
ncbi:MAG: hypothetical protein LBE34_00340 [Flavobacteriaceae bacterium]|jgi:hypothetical protein|nr:hypothetical protein [Flavobacteriaceae bacterium]